MNLYTCMQTNSRCYKNTSSMKPVGILWHSTGANNPNLKRYVQPADGSSNYNADIAKIGKNNNKNDYNHAALSSGLNAFIGKFADGSIGTIQTMPWEYRPWGCGVGKKGSCNDGWIQFEICEDNLKDKDYAQKVYNEAVELTAYLCKKYGLNPNGTVNRNGVAIPVITCHNDASKLGFASNHSDINHWFPNILGKNMINVREDVTRILGGGSAPKESSTPAPAPKPAAPSVTPSEPILRVGSKGDAVRSLQTKLKAIINPNLVIDGDFGNNTKNAVINFQKKYGLTPDGIYGPKSAAKMKEVYGSSNKAPAGYKVKITASALNVRRGPGSSYGVVNVLRRGEVYTIVKEQNGWGQLKSGQGWISLKYTQKV